ncbi:MAG TPA: TlpA disulfide reductase family protein [Vicinamibacterales bacterium]
MNTKTLVGALVVLALGVAGFMAVRYTRAVGEQLTSSTDAGTAGKPRVRFVKNPKPIPELTMTTLDGKTITSKDLAGKVVIVNFWATWCAPCRAEIPDLVKLQTQYKDHLVIIGVLSEDEPGPNVSRFVADYKMNYPVVAETPELSAAFTGIYALPTTFMVGPDGRMMQKHIGQIRPAQIELETRVLAKLPVDAEVEFEPDDKEAVLASNARATEIPGIDLSVLTAEQKTLALNRLNDEPCGCGCGMTIAQCRINDSTCAVSPKLADKIMVEVRNGK